MKISRYLCNILTIVFLLFCSCQNKDIDVNTFTISEEQVMPGIDTASFRGSYDFFLEAESMKIYVSRDSAMLDTRSIELTLEGQEFSGTLRGLRGNTVYYYRYGVDIGMSDELLTEMKEFKTLMGNEPIVHTLGVETISDTSVIVRCSVERDGGMGIVERGICWNNSGNPDISCQHVAHPENGLGEYTCIINGIEPSVSYYIRAFARSEAGIGYGEELEYRTDAIVYLVEVSATPAEGGTVEGGGTYHQGETCTVTARAAEGYVFSFWKENEIPVLQEPVYTFEVVESRFLMARFAEIAALPVVITGEVSEIGGVSAMGSGEVTGEGGSEVTERGVCWATGHVPTTSDSHAGNGSGTGAFMAEMTGLSLGTTYRVRAYAVNSEGTAYGEEKSFTTLDHQEYTVSVSASPSSGGTVEGGGSYEEGASCTVRATANNGYTFSNWTEDGNPVSTQANYTFNVTSNRNLVANFTQQITIPTVTTTPVTNITETSATGGGNVTSDGGATVTERGVCWGTSHNPTTSGSHGTSGSGLGSYTCPMTNLTPNTTYYVRAYATNSQGTAYGNEVSFVTTELPMYTINVSTNPPNAGSVNGGGSYQQGQSCSVTATASNGYDFVNWTENGNQVSTNASYTFTVTANRNLVANFTQQVTLPTVTTSQVTNITETAATGGGNVTSDGGATVTERGICWGTSHNPTTSGSHGTSGSGLGSYTCLMTNLTPNTTYYVRAYATNSQGTAYGNEVSFITTQLPTYTINVSASPTVGGSVSGGGTYQQGQSCTVTATANNGYDFVNWTENGGQVSTNASYTFTVTANRNLVANFTQQVTLPTVTTSQVTNITETAATGGGNVTSDGGATVTERGICWGTSHNPTTSGSHGTSGSGLGSYTCLMTNLTPNTTYYVRAYATNSQGTAYGNEVSFVTTQLPTYTINVSANPTVGGSVSGGGTYQQGQSCTVTATANNGYEFVNWTENGSQVSTNASYTFTVTANRNLVANFTQQVTLPTVTTSQVTNITETSATGGGNVTSDGGATVTERGICWGTSHNPTTSGSHGTSGSGMGSYTCLMTNLTPNTTYYVRAYATNSQGTAYGNEVSFVTTELPMYTINVSASPTVGGSVNGGGSYQQGQSCTVTATASNGYDFVNWTENGSQVSTNASYTFTVTANRNLVANFTQQITMPTVTTSQVINITETAATGGGNVTSDGGATVTERGICWSTSHNPTTSGSHGTSGSGLGSYTCLMTNLTPNTTYYVRAYATNSQGTAYGNEVSFTTAQLPTYTITVSANPTNGGSVNGGGTYQQGQSCTVTATASNGYDFVNWTENGSQVSTNASYTFTVTANRTLVANFTQQITLPTVTTSQVTNITETSATGGGNVTADGGATVTVRGICWSTSHNPTTSDSHGTSGSGLGSYTCLMTGLTPNTTYYVRAYATNSQGTAYGDEVSFTTAQLPTYTITVTTNGGGGSVSGGGTYQQGQSCTVTAMAGSGYDFVNWTENGSQVSTSANYTFTVTSNRTLVANFVIQATLPLVTTNEATSITQTTAIGGGNVWQDGNATVTSRGVCWSTNHNPTTSNNHTQDGTGTGSFTSNITGLSANTTYYVRAYATNSAGTAYGNEVSFVTRPQPPTGAIDGWFSVSPTKQVYFAQGNMQYRASTNTWRFAEHQWDYVGGNYQGTQYGNVSGSSNNDASSTYSGWIDLFGFGTSGWNSGAIAYQPYSTSMDNADYYPGGSYTNNLTGVYAHADWAYHNPISNGGNQTGLWRCLTSEEYIYLIEGRPNASQKYSLAYVNNVSGLIILPDDWTLPEGISFSPQMPYGVNIYSLSQWQQMEAVGAVFLPITGSRQLNSYYAVGIGDYWSSTAMDGEVSHSLSFFNNTVYQGDSRYRNIGTAVRPVYEVQ